MSVKPPEKVQPIQATEKFSFDCGPEVPCFTECCRALELVLTPYDALRLRHRLGLDSATFLERYAAIEGQPDEAFPLVYLSMLEDERQRCPFVGADGCAVYEDRPAACRAYPVGRGLRMTPCRSHLQELFVLVREEHCQGFAEPREITPEKWMADQELEPYNTFSEAMLPLLRHPIILQGWQPTPEQQQEYLHTLYQPEYFRQRVAGGEISPPAQTGIDRHNVAELDDYQLLLAAIKWLPTTWPGHKSDGRLDK
ncbi:YkgJ family cysteine cluster protein [Desulfurivibrio dismutans]|uniref:YkgJ family cysteine cluster protein n=1 Tax=Desulfurivibrio dismutans TaxID=1398908 RepID=UPI0023DA072F|nr:YkgJ family cysteine cluster protein [Desulfurivibrio alkaliphilus]MDF1614924.1 YkgJ family cysteine cluster protein [Desulfurivibrio alkaliphilus]